MGWLDNIVNSVSNFAPVQALREIVTGEPEAPPPVEAQPTMEGDTSELSGSVAQQYAAYAPQAKTPIFAQTQTEKVKIGSEKSIAEHLQQADANSAVAPSDNDQNLVLDFLNDTEKKAFLELDKDQREQFGKLFGTVGGNWGADANADLQAATAAAKKLLVSDKLLDVDSKGNTLLSTLGKACSIDRQVCDALKDHSIEKSGQFSELLCQLAEPTSIYQGSGTVTCGPSSTQTLLASSQPAEFSRIATDLIFKGESTVGNNDTGYKTLKASTSALDDHEAGRSFFSALIQGSFMDFAHQLSAEKEANNLQESAEEYGGRGGSGGSFRGDGVEKGLTEAELNDMSRYLTGDQSAYIKVTPETSKGTMTALQTALDKKVPVTCGIHVDDGGGGYGHAITVSRIENENVYYSDPMKFDQPEQSMPLAKFKGCLELAVVPLATVEEASRLHGPLHLVGANEVESDYGGRGGSGGSRR